MFTVKVDTRQVEKLLANIKSGAERVARDAINDAAKHVRAEAVRHIRNEWNVPAKTVRDAIRIRKATVAELSATVTASGKPIGLIKFGAKQYLKARRVAGVSYLLRRAEGRQRLSGAFIATMPDTGHVGVFLPNPPARPAQRGRWAGKRVTRGPRKGQLVLRNPIIERRVISIPSQWNQVIGQHARAGEAYLQRRLQSRLERLLATGK